jgi:hypothetical protein
LQVRDKLGQYGHRELMLGGDPLLDALIDFGHRGRRSVELALMRLRLGLRLQTLPVLKCVLFLRRYAKLAVEALSASHKLSTLAYCNHLTYSHGVLRTSYHCYPILGSADNLK